VDLDQIFTIIQDRQCLPFLGAGASADYTVGATQVPGVPLGGKFTQLILDKCRSLGGSVNGSPPDLLTAAEYLVYLQSGSRNGLESLIATEIARVTRPRPIHTVLAQLSEIGVIITTNYDQLLETEIGKYGRPLIKHVYDPYNPRTGVYYQRFPVESPNIVLHKMHGTVEQRATMVITQSDYIRYLANLTDPERGMPEYFRKTVIPNQSLLFLGYSLRDWNFRVIWEGVLSHYAEIGTQLMSYAVVRQPTDFDRYYFRNRNIVLIDGDLTEFAKELARKFDLEIPQLGIKKNDGTAA